MKDRPSVYAVPATEDLKDQVAASIATRIIEYLESELDLASVLHKAVYYAAQHGTVALKPYFDPQTNRVAIHIAPLSNLWIQDKNDYTKADWVVFHDNLEEWEAKELLHAAGKDTHVSTESYLTTDGIDREGVKKLEIWYKPCFRFPNGLYACLVGDQVVESHPFPYLFPEKDGEPKPQLPLVVIKARDNRNSVYGETWVTSCVPLQRTLNIVNSKILEKQGSFSQTWQLRPQSMANGTNVDVRNAILYFNDSDPVAAATAKEIRYIEPGPMDPGLYDQRAYLKQSIYDVAGISETTAGAPASSSQSGKAIGYQAALDAQKNADALKSIETATKSLFEYLLKLIQAYYDAPRIAEMAGELGLMHPAFTGADLAGFRVKLEPRSSRESYESTKQELLKQDALAGLPVDSAQLTDPFSAAVSRQVALDLIEQLLAGGNVEISPESMDPNIMISVINEQIAQASIERNFEKVKILQSLYSYIMRLLSQQPAAPAAPAKASAQPLPESPQPLPENPEEVMYQ